MIEISNVVKSFHHKEVLNIEQLTIHKGETVAVMGMNGAGKSTLIKLISGLFNQDQGWFFRSNMDLVSANFSYKPFYHKTQKTSNPTITDCLFF